MPADPATRPLLGAGEVGDRGEVVPVEPVPEPEDQRSTERRRLQELVHAVSIGRCRGRMAPLTVDGPR